MGGGASKKKKEAPQEAYKLTIQFISSFSRVVLTNLQQQQKLKNNS